MNDPIIWQIMLQVALIALNAVFACAEIAVISMNDNKLAHLAAQGDKRAVRLARLTSQPARFLATIQVAITLSGFLGSAFAADNFSDRLVAFLLSVGVPIPLATLDALSVILITLILSYFTLVFGELVPKRLAMKKAETLALGLATLLSAVAKLTAPIVWVLTASTNCILRLFGVDPNAEDENLSEEEIRMMVDMGSQKGVIDREEKEFIQKVFEFDDLPVGACVTHRKELSVLWLEDSMEDWDKTIHETRFSRYPVCGDSVDHIVGILDAKHYFRLTDKSRETVLAEAVRPAYFVPYSICADVLFRQMKTTRNHVAVVLDEYGGVLGILTMYDLLEQLVGDLDDDDSKDPEPESIQQLDEHTWQLRGVASLAEVARQLELSLPVSDFDTFGGFVFAQYGFVPADGMGFILEMDGYTVRVTEIRERRLEKALLVKHQAAQGHSGLS